jgi:hypothetical protein
MTFGAICITREAKKWSISLDLPAVWLIHFQLISIPIYHMSNGISIGQFAYYGINSD